MTSDYVNSIAVFMILCNSVLILFGGYFFFEWLKVATLDNQWGENPLGYSTTISWRAPSDLYIWFTSDYVNFIFYGTLVLLSVTSWMLSTGLWEYAKYYALSEEL